jgi:hypothetical protein
VVAGAVLSWRSGWRNAESNSSRFGECALNQKLSLLISPATDCKTRLPGKQKGDAHKIISFMGVSLLTLDVHLY